MISSKKTLKLIKSFPLYIKKEIELRSSGQVPAKQAIKIFSRGATILPFCIGYIFAIHNGKRYKVIKIQNEHVGYKFGEFALTRLSKQIEKWKKK